MPAVSVIIPTYNNAPLVPRAIDSVLAQTFTDYEIIVVDDGSTDNTLAVLETYGDQIILVRQSNQERSVARNNGIHHATGKYIAFLDDDDWWHPEKLKKQVLLMESKTSIGLVCAQAYQVAPNGDIVGVRSVEMPTKKALPDKLPWFFLGFSIPTLTVLARREVILKAGGFDPTIRYIEDWDLWMRMSIYTEMVCIPEPLAYYQLHGRYLPATFDYHNMQEGRPHVLQQVLRLVDELGAGDRLPFHIRARGMARAYWYAALIDYAIQKTVSARERTLQAWHADQSFFEETGRNSAAEMLVGFAVSLYDTETSYEEASTFVNTVLENLPPETFNSFSTRAIYGALLMWFGHLTYRNKRFHKACHFMQRALWADPHLISNRGVLSVLIRSVIKS